ncbi:hypothetical protein ST201phi2-1p294 [Pseudomonas phage 201phi2-1]|uniref:Uncharacterized protein n=1 Tax=Pseudomonas phage 201phi2-1 TaxID=198110 RepID=B3FJF4_BP201|nr:hypothetical protein ST201phi2-1p294 [Pseudomonas phage 201phi2-1]ABY63120.1 hypothetical protein 201phi2-1p294 [Pseudomonas phage 201phi2-1]
MKRITTDLSVSLKDLTVEKVREIVMSTEDDLWAKPYVDTICEDFGYLDPGMWPMSELTVRHLAVHAYNRGAYYNARTGEGSRNAQCHQFMDLLLSYASSMEGSLPPSLRYKESERMPYLIYEQLGKFDFLGYIKNVPELSHKWSIYGWEIQSVYSYE